MSKHSLISSQRVKGTDIYGPDDTKVGQIEAMMIEKLSGRVRYAVEGYRTGITEDQLKTAPRHDAAVFGDRDWESRVHGHYGTPEYWELGARAFIGAR
jgi:hypothetical protein